MGKRRATPGTKQLNLEVTEGLLAEAKAFAQGRGETMRQVVETALRRHMAYPPAPPPPPAPLPTPEPLPDAAPAPPPAKAKKPGRKKG